MDMIHYDDRPVSDRPVSLAQWVPPVKLSPPFQARSRVQGEKTLPVKPAVPPRLGCTRPWNGCSGQ